MNRILFFLVNILISTVVAFSQKVKIWGKDFDYKNLSVIDTFSSDALPKYYVCGSYENGLLTDIDIFRKENGMGKYLRTHATVILKEGYALFVYDPGKAKTGGYGRLFSKKTKLTDTAMLRNDTLIYKTTRFGTSSVLIRYITSIYSDSIVIDDKIFSLGSRKMLRLSSLASFENYLTWNLLNNFSRYYQMAITPKADDIVKAKKHLDNFADYSYSGRHTKYYFKLQEMRPSLFWIKHSGIIY